VSYLVTGAMQFGHRVLGIATGINWYGYCWYWYCGYCHMVTIHS
jgi:hypothetical protein